MLLYLLSADPGRADRAETLLARGGCVSVQVLNEFVAVARRKLDLPWPEIREILSVVRAVCRVEPVTTATHDKALDLAGHYGFSFYDALIVAAAVLADCTTLHTEDLQAGQRIGKRLTVRNPFIDV